MKKQTSYSFNNLIERIKVRHLTNERKIANRLNVDLVFLESLISGNQEFSDDIIFSFKRFYKIDVKDTRNNNPLSALELKSNKLILTLLIVCICGLVIRFVENLFYPSFPGYVFVSLVFVHLLYDVLFIVLPLAGFCVLRKNKIALFLLLPFIMFLIWSTFDVVNVIKFFHM